MNREHQAKRTNRVQEYCTKVREEINRDSADVMSQHGEDEKSGTTGRL